MSNTRVEKRMKALAIGVLLLFSAATVSAQVTPAQQAREELALGVQAYKSANYDEAVEHFQRAVLLNDDLCVAKLYLATAYAQQYVPGVEARDNVAMANHAIDQYRATLKCDPRNVNPTRRPDFRGKAGWQYFREGLLFCTAGAAVSHVFFAESVGQAAGQNRLRVCRRRALMRWRAGYRGFPG